MDKKMNVIGRLKNALSYLRVSTDEQTKTDYDQDGLSLIAQREGVGKKATGLQAMVVKEFSDPGKSAFKDLQKRTGFLALLEELKRRNAPGAPKAERIDYVIVWSCSRWARNVVDHWQARYLMRELGVRFISVMEPMVGEDTAAAFAYENLIVSQGQYQSMYSGELVSRGLLTKAKNGGTYGQAKTGYLNDLDQLPTGSHVRIIKPDPDRSHFITQGFDLFASGLYTISRLANDMYDLGLRSRPSNRSPGGRKVSTSTWHRILRDPYYLGLIVYKRGTPDEQVFDGLHDALTDEATFEKVQMLLDQHRVSGERAQHRHHYLKGSVFCKACELRLAYGVSTGRNGSKYPYFFCSSRVNQAPHDCGSRANVRPDLIEDVIQEVYESDLLDLGAEDLQARIEAVENLAAVSEQASEKMRATKARRVEKLQAQQSRLLRLHIEEGDAISPDAFRKERTRLQEEIEAAERSLAVAEERLTFDGEVYKMALELVGDVAQVYEDAPTFLRRTYNQVFFEHLWITPVYENGVRSPRPGIEAERAWPFDVLLAPDFAEQVTAEAERIRHSGAQATENGPEGPFPVIPEVTCGVSIYEDLAEGVGFEPTRPLTRPNGFQGRRIQPLCHPSAD
jgi:site-specific DNA recombinase